MKQYNYHKGKWGEEEARRFLVKLGMKWIESNSKNNLGEIDLIMDDGGVLVFIEVKMKSGDFFGTPEEMISRSKLAQVKRSAQSYLYFNPDKERIYQKFRIDAVCIVLNEDRRIKRISHYRNLY